MKQNWREFHPPVGRYSASHDRRHLLSKAFLKENLLLNKLGPMKYQTGNWEINNPELGAFDLTIGSDVLYERQQPSSIVTPRRLPKLLSSTRIGVTGSVFAGK